jgi:uncharacterized protein
VTSAGQPQRLQSLDVLRGMALLGMFIVHFHERTTDAPGVDELLRTLIWRLVESKSHGTFAVLFGAGFAIQLRRAEQRGARFSTIYLRRLGVLALFGFAAHAFFGFNVLLGYAIWGVPLLLVHAWSTRALLITAFLSGASVGLFQLVNTTAISLTAGEAGVERHVAAQEVQAERVNANLAAAEAQPGYLVLLGARLRHMAWFYSQPFFFMPNVTLALFIVGLLLVRHRVLEDPASHGRVLAIMVVFGTLSWLAANWMLPFSFGLIRDQWLTFAYIAGALWLLGSVPALIGRLQFIAAAGRMALTNYLLQIAMLDLLFSGYALHRQPVRPPLGLAAAVSCFAIECVWSTVWLKHFQFGPVEWLWRSLTYGERQPMRRAAPGLATEGLSPSR